LLPRSRWTALQRSRKAPVRPPPEAVRPRRTHERCESSLTVSRPQFSSGRADLRTCIHTAAHRTRAKLRRKRRQCTQLSRARADDRWSGSRWTGAIRRRTRRMIQKRSKGDPDARHFGIRWGWGGSPSEARSAAAHRRQCAPLPPSAAETSMQSANVSTTGACEHRGVVERPQARIPPIISPLPKPHSFAAHR
jgi:hypothetical protein